MTREELRLQAVDPPLVGHGERYEDSEQFVGFVVGPTVKEPSNVARALQEALCCGQAASCGCACDSNCACR